MQQMVMQQQQAQQQQEAAAQQQQAGAVGADQGGGEEGGGGGDDGKQAPAQGQGAPTENQKTDGAAEASASPGGGDLSTGADQALGALSKAEKQLPPSKRRLLTQQKILIEDFIGGWKADMRELTKDIINVADTLKPKE